MFLLFLDCVHQLLWQFPARFEFTQTYLVSLWDATHVSVCDTFLFNSERERQLAIAGNVSLAPVQPKGGIVHLTSTCARALICCPGYSYLA